MKGQTEHGGATDDRTVALVQGVDAGHRGGADAVGKLVAIAGRGGGEQVEQELRTAARPLDGQLQDVRRHLGRLGRGHRDRPHVLEG